jgi:hypothetical protein
MTDWNACRGQVLAAVRTLALLALIATTADAAVLPLRPGTFVLMDQPCANPPFAAMFDYDGREFSYPHASRCRSTILSHAGKTYRRRETCSALGDGSPARSVTTVSTYEILSRTELRVSDTAHRGAGYRWCSGRREPRLR